MTGEEGAGAGATCTSSIVARLTEVGAVKNGGQREVRYGCVVSLADHVSRCTSRPLETSCMDSCQASTTADPLTQAFQANRPVLPTSLIQLLLEHPDQFNHSYHLFQIWLQLNISVSKKHLSFALHAILSSC